jgi:uncharacterized protein (TIGR00369 family)
MLDQPSAPSSVVPDGFRQIEMGGDYVAFLGPLFARWTGEKVLLGFRVQQRHCNPVGICHGGMLATLADVLVPCAAMYQVRIPERRFLPTVSLQVDFMGAASLGAWVQGEAQILRVTRNLVFGQGMITVDGEPGARMSGVYKIGQPNRDPRDEDPLGLK